ncbi:LysR family transcriptional regulator [Granulosicoccus sp. 3-233]|uniref:LysR family transcriptional regulator n=1 Tax=Granulosicoccus sp. 3-233 TaxID=3417969 RepID=UPI003D34AE30
MNWDDLKYFLAVAREGQILGASKKLDVSQATLNRRISNLEQDLGKKLFDRSTTGCVLLAPGQVLLEHAERVESEMIQTTADLRDDTQVLSGTVRIGAPDGFGVSFLAPRLQLLAEQHPQLKIQLVPMPRVFSLSQREADIAITIGRPKKGRLRVRKLTDYSLRLYAAKSYLEQMGTPQQLDDLNQHRLVGYVEDLIFSSELEYNKQIYSSWRSAIEISGVIGQFEAVRAGAGIGVLHDFMAARDPSLIPVLPDDSTLSRSYWMVWHESLKNSRRVQVVVEFLTEAVKTSSQRF